MSPLNTIDHNTSSAKILFTKTESNGRVLYDNMSYLYNIRHQEKCLSIRVGLHPLGTEFSTESLRFASLRELFHSVHAFEILLGEYYATR